MITVAFDRALDAPPLDNDSAESAEIAFAEEMAARVACGEELPGTTWGREATREAEARRRAA